MNEIKKMNEWNIKKLTSWLNEWMKPETLRCEWNKENDCTYV